MYQFQDDKLRLDIGTQLDLFEAKGFDSTTTWRAGVGVQTWTRLRSEGNFKFPVETADYWFGVHLMYGSASSWHARLRIAHISSHMVDGLADTTGTLRSKPFVYSREFAELLGGVQLGWLRPYAGATIVWSTIPDNPNPIIPEIGMDLRMPLPNGWWIVGGYDLRLVGIDGIYAAQNAAQLGVSHDLWRTTGIWVGLYGFSGRSMHGMFYNQFDRYLATGFQIQW